MPHSLDFGKVSQKSACADNYRTGKKPIKQKCKTNYSKSISFSFSTFRCIFSECVCVCAEREYVSEWQWWRGRKITCEGIFSIPPPLRISFCESVSLFRTPPYSFVKKTHLSLLSISGAHSLLGWHLCITDHIAFLSLKFFHITQWFINIRVVYRCIQIQKSMVKLQIYCEATSSIMSNFG